MRSLVLGVAVGLALLACAPTKTAEGLTNGCPSARGCAAGGAGAGGAAGSAGAIGAGGSGGDGSGGSGGSASTGDRCSNEMTATLNALLRSNAAQMGFGYAPELDGAAAGGSVTRVDPDGLIIETDSGGTVRLGWPSELPLDVSLGARVVASRGGGWDIVTTEAVTVAVYADDAFEAPRAVGALPDGPTLEFSLDCRFPDSIGTACGRPPKESLALRVGADGRFLAQGETGDIENWTISNIRAIQQPGFQVGSCVAEPRFVATVAAVRSGSVDTAMQKGRE